MLPKSARRKIQLNRRIIGPPAPRAISLDQRKLSDYPNVSQAHKDAARKLSSPLLLGPPICDELMAFVEHLLSEEQADLFRHLGALGWTSPHKVAKAAHRPLDEVQTILHHLAREQHSIWGEPHGDSWRYRLLPIVPGIFEITLIGQDSENLTPWHRRFAELFEALFDTGFSKRYLSHDMELIRFLPVGQAVDTMPMALPSDKMEVVLDRYDSFAVGNCQCRLTMEVNGRGCGKPQRNCTAMGEWADSSIEMGQMQRISRREYLEIKREAESNGLVSWVVNSEDSKGQASCSCCGCCCHIMRLVNEFNAPVGIAPPHFNPQIDRSRCNYCGACARTCPMGALVVDRKGQTGWQLYHRCIGCGLCALACSEQKAITMEPVPDYRLPPDSWFSMITRSAGGLLKNVASAWWQR